MSTSAVDNVVASMANATVSDPIAEAAIAGDNKAAAEAAAASATDGRRLYIGNLAYATTEGELKEFFKGYLV
jgi:RNA recognition motif-containing protein